MSIKLEKAWLTIVKTMKLIVPSLLSFNSILAFKYSIFTRALYWGL